MYILHIIYLLFIIQANKSFFVKKQKKTKTNELKGYSNSKYSNKHSAIEKKEI